MLFNNVLQKNLPIMSARAYAYRRDVSAQDAVQYVRSSFVNEERVYVADYDFSAFFDNIEHEPVLRTLRDHFLLTGVERSAIESFLEIGALPPSDYDGNAAPRRTTGIPQGTSVSLLLANAAAWDLDRELEGLGIGFTRYADDTLIWARSYEQICEAVEVLKERSAEMGVRINREKSSGIRLLLPPGVKGEIESTSAIEYLGYEIGLDSVKMKSAAIDRIRQRIDGIVYWGLLHEPMNHTQDPARVAGNVDSDYVSVIWRLRRYLYGDLSERAVRRYQRRETPLRRFKGVMSAYPLIDDSEELLELDRWLATRLWLALRRRSELLRAIGVVVLPSPHGLSREQLVKARTVSGAGQAIDLRIPSFRRIANVMRQASALHGPSTIGRATPYGY